ncbi:MAG: hypothetical protein ACREH9_00750 [Pseudomonadota bacterium]
MRIDNNLSRRQIGVLVSRRTALAAAATLVAAPAFAAECRIGPPPHPQGPSVWMNMDQVELDAAYDPNGRAVLTMMKLAA